MSDLNLVILKGRVAKAAEYHVLDSGKGVAEWRMAVALGPRVTEYHAVKVWRHADELAPRLVKGVTVLVEGVLRARPYKTKDGSPRTEISVAANRVLLLDGLDEAEQPNRGPGEGDGDGDGEEPPF
jgi:single-stranded DNA-binding protein